MPQSSSHFSSNPSLQISPMSVSSSLASIPSFDNNGVDTQASLNRLQQVIGLLDSTLRLPSTPRAFMVYLLGLAIVLVGAFLHILIAAQIMQAEFTLSQLQEEYRAIEQQNGDIIFQIARDTNMARLHERVISQGYVPVQEREYVVVKNIPIAAKPSAEMTVAEDNTRAIASAAAEPAPATNVQATEPMSALPPVTTMIGGQFARWETFWTAQWQSTFGNAAGSQSTDNTASPVVITPAEPANVSTNFWSVWWGEATEQGTKLLEQFSSQ